MELSMKVKGTSYRSRSMTNINQRLPIIKQKKKSLFSKFSMHENSSSHSTNSVEFPVVWNELRSNRQLCDGVVKCANGQEFKVINKFTLIESETW